MGGHALKKSRTRRYCLSEYNKTIQDVLPIISRFFGWISVPAHFNEKESFGDLDVLVFQPLVFPDFKLKNELEKALGSKEVVANGPVWSFEYKEFQIDIIPCATWTDFVPLVAFSCYGDLGMLLGVFATTMGLSFGQDGVSIRVINPWSVLEEKKRLDQKMEGAFETLTIVSLPKLTKMKVTQNLRQMMEILGLPLEGRHPWKPISLLESFLDKVADKSALRFMFVCEHLYVMKGPEFAEQEFIHSCDSFDDVELKILPSDYANMAEILDWVKSSVYYDSKVMEPSLEKHRQKQCVKRPNMRAIAPTELEEESSDDKQKIREKQRHKIDLKQQNRTRVLKNFPDVFESYKTAVISDQLQKVAKSNWCMSEIREAIGKDGKELGQCLSAFRNAKTKQEPDFMGEVHVDLRRGCTCPTDNKQEEPKEKGFTCPTKKIQEEPEEHGVTDPTENKQEDLEDAFRVYPSVMDFPEKVVVTPGGLLDPWHFYLLTHSPKEIVQDIVEFVSQAEDR